ncbi:ABC transporter permease [Clostridium saccharobutylicum]|uniref:Ribose transport system permease protein RbsC n=1 Tax=Clostridium saccharobutylicum DSM 13864 TaxID=1345695 RepID=U5MVI2_CLOSA|nr:ABC transporter permease [Clostridium saccharobutylicum]AGX44605.1 ribose transport system permease protein RbsC [Clostridium saccharobutylicum DSM 13864]AQR91896.1 ribose transport system permease protein RbsC [Clostridium saccharobutylicum]AQS01798.1 ribose transport system permease protein RbsC [Clostridium saccharobutylicum]AQS11400.1 ribose transport system permease protein RbsC [Clostridium saccharobutylicum]AQS15781.1 ribose transport system permease protein RbsC [Clostridium sacchar
MINSKVAQKGRIKVKMEGFDIKSLFLKYSIYLVLAILVLAFSIASPDFLGAANLSNFLRQIPTVGILTVAITMVIVTGGVDLSIGAIAAFSGCTVTYLAVKGISMPVCLLAGLLIGSLWGLFNGILITKFKLESFILTMGTCYLIRGLILFFTNGIYIKGVPDWFYDISNTEIGISIIHTNTIVFVVIVLVIAYLMKNTRFGRYCYVVGSNKEAGRLSGINVNKHVIKVYVIEGFLAAIAGILLMSSINVGAPSEINGPDLFAMAGAIMGGVQFGGGVGTIGGAMVGIFTIQVFQSGLAILGINSFLQQAVTGAIIVLAIVVDFYRKGTLFKKKG